MSEIIPKKNSKSLLPPFSNYIFLKQHNFSFFLLIFIVLGSYACNKSEDANLYTITILKDGTPVADHFVSINDLRFSSSGISDGHTDQNGKVKLDLNDWVIDEEMEENLSILAVDRMGCGYTKFDLSQFSYTIDISTEEQVTIEIISPDLQNQKFQPNTEIPIKIRMHSNLLPFRTKLSSVAALNGKLNAPEFEGLSIENYDGLELQDLIDSEGIAEFSYFTTEGENGFFIRYNNNVHGESASPVELFSINME